MNNFKFCEVCKGSGRQGAYDECPHCYGSGVSPEPEVNEDEYQSALADWKEKYPS